MPIGLYDIRDRAPVYSPDEIAAGRAAAEKHGLDYIAGDDGRAIPLATYVYRLNRRWVRAVATGRQFQALTAGYCTIEAKGAPPPSDARH
jgi:hypothetical protein